jgi:hypothetical protein
MIVVGDEFGRVHFLQLVEADETNPSLADINKPKEGGLWRFWKWLWGRSS